MSLADKHCVPCRGGVPPLQGGELAAMASQVAGWSVVDGHHLARSYAFPDFRAALEFVNRVGATGRKKGTIPICVCPGAGWMSRPGPTRSTV